MSARRIVFERPRFLRMCGSERCIYLTVLRGNWALWSCRSHLAKARQSDASQGPFPGLEVYVFCSHFSRARLAERKTRNGSGRSHKMLSPVLLWAKQWSQGSRLPGISSGTWFFLETGMRLENSGSTRAFRYFPCFLTVVHHMFCDL